MCLLLPPFASFDDGEQAARLKIAKAEAKSVFVFILKLFNSYFDGAKLQVLSHICNSQF
jgi:hypothetical protein